MSNPTEYVVSSTRSGHYLALGESGKSVVVDRLDKATRFHTATGAARAIGSIASGVVCTIAAEDICWTIKRLRTVTRHELEEV